MPVPQLTRVKVFQDTKVTIIKDVAELDRLTALARENTLSLGKFRKVAATETVDTALIVPAFNVAHVSSIGEGDADVFTQSGRHTTVTVRTEGLSIYADAKAIQFSLLYRVEEGHEDYTTLESRSQVIIPVPDETYSIVRIRADKLPTNYSGVFYGKDHEWHDISDQPGVTNTYLNWLAVKFDGKGRDDNGNAQLRASIVVPVTLQKD